MGIQTTSITTTAANDLTLAPASGKDVKITSVTANPGTTPLSVDSTNTVAKLDANLMTELTTLASGDLIVVQTQTVRADSTAGTTVIGQMYKSNRANLISGGGGGAGVSSFSAGTTGFTPSSATAGDVVLAGTLGVANGGTGATTQAAAAINLLPDQSGKSGYVLSTDGTDAVWVDDISGLLPPATLAEALAGTLTTKYSSPETAVPKDASGMTGAAIIPNGTTLQTPVAASGMFRLDTSVGSWFGSDGAAFTPFDQRFARVTSSALSADPQDYVVVTAATQTVTLPNTPTAGLCVTVIVAGTFKDTIVARNGLNIMGLAQDITLDIEYAALQFTYTGDATQGWRIN